MKFEIRLSEKFTTQPYYATIVGANGETLFTSEMYATYQSAYHAATLVRVLAPTAQIVDLTGRSGVRR